MWKKIVVTGSGPQWLICYQWNQWSDTNLYQMSIWPVHLQSRNPAILMAILTLAPIVALDTSHLPDLPCFSIFILGIRFTHLVQMARIHLHLLSIMKMLGIICIIISFVYSYHYLYYHIIAYFNDELIWWRWTESFR